MQPRMQGGVDGLWASYHKRQVSIVVGPATYQHASRAHFRPATNYKGEISAAAYAMKNTGGLWTNERECPMPRANVQQAILYRMGKSTMNMMMNGGVGCHEDGRLPALKRDRRSMTFTRARATGERFFTMHVLTG